MSILEKDIFESQPEEMIKPLVDFSAVPSSKLQQLAAGFSAAKINTVVEEDFYEVNVLQSYRDQLAPPVIKNEKAMDVYDEVAESDIRNRKGISGRNESTKKLISAFSALLKDSRTKTKFGEYYVEIVSNEKYKFTEHSEDLIYGMMYAGRRVGSGKFVLPVKEAALLCFNTTKPANMQKFMQLAIDLDEVSKIRVHLTPVRPEVGVLVDGESLSFVKSVKLTETEFEVVFTDDFLTMFSENPAYCIDFARRRRLRMQDAKRILDHFHTIEEFRARLRTGVPKAELIDAGICISQDALANRTTYWKLILKDFFGADVGGEVTPTTLFLTKDGE